MVIVVIAAIVLSFDDLGHEDTIKLKAGNPHHSGVVDSRRNFYRRGTDG